MGQATKTLPFLLLLSASASAQATPAYVQPAMAQPRAAATVNVAQSFADWRRLRQGGNFSFPQYAHFLIYNRGWPGEAALRRSAERAMRPGENAATVIAFYLGEKPASGNGWMRYADALLASGRSQEAIIALKEAWASPDLPSADAARLLASYGAYLTPQDHNRRADALLFDKDPTNAATVLQWTSLDRRPAFAARIAMQSRSPNADALFRTAAHRLGADAGLMMDRLRYLRDGGNEHSARVLAAQPHTFTERPADVERWYEMLLLLANGAAEDRQWQLAYNISRQLDDALPVGAPLADQHYGVRDNYTSLAWLSARTALDRLNKPANAAAMFYRYAQGGKSLQVASKGWYWAGRASLAAGRAGDASAYFQRAALSPELFYGQLALERLGRPVPAPQPLPIVAGNDPARTAFAGDSLTHAMRYVARYGSSVEQTMFARALADSLDNHSKRALAMELSRQINRPDVAVWVARQARNNGEMFYVRDGFPTLPASAPIRTNWSLAHGITRQESSFEPNAVSHAGARGMMQLMPGTAREQSGKLGVEYSASRLTSDPNYNVLLGSAYFQRMLNSWDGSVPLAVASYNAGAGNVRKWVRAYGDPRSNHVDIIGWIEAIPFSETRGYVQRVIENSVVYDTMNPQPQAQTAFHVSRYLGKGSPG